ncbi:MAG: hypothetical protein GEU71_06885 [Actinobacteria bacterium]|nr:hypothetical protein [Actinomycetota bacterium]
MSPVRVVTLAGNPEREPEIAAQLADHTNVDLLMRCMDRMELLAAMRGGGIDAIVSVGAPAWFDAASAEEAARAGLRVVGVVEDATEADRLGALGASLIPAGSSATEIVSRCLSGETPPPPARPSSQPSKPDGRLLAVWGPKGAPGRSSVAIELAYEIAAAEEACLLIDGDPYGGDIVQMLGFLEEVPTVVWAAALAAKDELDAARLELDLRRSAPGGPVVLPGLPRGTLWPDVSEFGWRQLLTVARSSFSSTVCDCGFSTEGPEALGASGSGRDRMTRLALTEADKVIAVCRSDPLGLKNFLWAYEELSRIVEPDKVRIVANRVPRGGERDIGDLIRKHLGKRPTAYIPYDPAAFGGAISSGRAVREMGPGGSVPTAIRSLCASLGAPAEHRGFLTRLAGTR